MKKLIEMKQDKFGRTYTNKVAIIYSIKKNGERYKNPMIIEALGNEKSQEDVLARLEANNPNHKFEIALNGEKIRAMIQILQTLYENEVPTRMEIVGTFNTTQQAKEVLRTDMLKSTKVVEIKLFVLEITNFSLQIKIIML